MKRVVLIVTGQAEHRALPASLQRFFPGVQFEPLYRDSFMSSPLPGVPAMDPTRPSLVEKLARDLVAAVDPGRTGEPADLAILIDDLELANTAAPERAVHHVRMAVMDHVERRWPSADRREGCLRRVRERCSFHLFAPMLEAYFFGEPAALRRAGARREALLEPGRDIEDFQAVDDEYLELCSEAIQARGQRKPTSAWAQSPDRHPKRYLQFLCDPTGRDLRAYQETKGGCNALRSLDWDSVLARKEHVRFGRALLTDLAYAVGRDDLIRRWEGDSHPLTSSPGPDQVLRNI